MALRTTGLTKRFGGLTAVDDVSFELASDECCSLIGPNGAGKTTFFNLLTGVMDPTAGTVEYRPAAGDRPGGVAGDGSGSARVGDGDSGGAGNAGAGNGGAGNGGAGNGGGAAASAGDGWVDVTDYDTHQTALAGLHRSYQITNVFATSTVLENVRIAAQAHGGTDSWKVWRNANSFTEYTEQAYAILDRVGLADQAETVAQNLSHGQKRNLEVAIALAGDPDVLLLDEPTSGVSTDGIDEVKRLIDDVAEDHAVLLVEHNMDVVMELSDRIAVLHQGELIADDDPEAIRNDERVQEAYLGGYDPDEHRSATGGVSP
ncbi:MAG: ABC transporter ATP-binding protein [Halopenitus sp.]